MTSPCLIVRTHLIGSLLIVAPMAMLADSHASFEHRAKEVGLSSDNVRALVDQQVRTFNNLAFAICKQPGQIDDGSFDLLVDSVFGARASLGLISSLRQLAYESVTVSIAAIKQRLETTDDAAPRKLPPQEREERRRQQMDRLTGLAISGPMEPSNHLVDQFCQMAEEACVRYIPLSKCSSREQEIASQRTDKQILTIENSHVCAKPKVVETSVDVSTDLKVMQAFTRRGLALEQANLMSFEVHDMVARTFMQHLTRAVPPGFLGPTIQSVLRADHELWVLASDQCRASLKRNAAGVLPLDQAFRDHYSSAQVVFHMLAVPVSKRGKGHTQQSSSSDEGHKEKKKKAKKVKKTEKGDKVKRQPTVPEVLRGHTGTDAKGRRICFNYNLPHGCKLPTKGTPPKCSRGLHVCIKRNCHGEHPVQSCTAN